MLVNLPKMMSIFEPYAQGYHITFNPAKIKIIMFNVSIPIYLNGTSVTAVNKNKHLGNNIFINIYCRNIISVQ